MKRFLKENKIKFHKINENADEIQKGSFCPLPKIYADRYIDDRGFPAFPGWDVVYGYYYQLFLNSFGGK